MIIVLADVSEHQRTRGKIQIVADEIGNHFVREMSPAAHDALLHGPGIRPDLEHLGIVIRFDDQQVRAAQVDLDGVGQVAQIGGQADLDPLRPETKPDWIDGVVRNRKAIDFDIADREGGARLKAFQRGLKIEPIDSGRGKPGDKDRLAAFPGQRHQSGHMIGVFVRDDNAVQAVLGLANRIQAEDEFFAAQTGVDDNACTCGGNEGGVAGTAARENANLNDARPLKVY